MNVRLETKKPENNFKRKNLFLFLGCENQKKLQIRNERKNKSSHAHRKLNK